MKFLWIFFALISAILAKPAFEVIWNVPSGVCENVRPDRYNITTNSGRKFRGDQFVIFYEMDLGLYPFCRQMGNENECGDPVNGGVPQAVNMSAHLEKVRADVERAIPDPNYSNLAVIDYEAWRPLFDLNWSRREVYKKYSIQLVLDKYPGLGHKSAEYLARYLFDTNGKLFFLETIKMARSVRPNAKWAFWDFPLCNYDVGYSGELKCRPEYEIINDQLLWLFNASDVILPPIYFYTDPFTSDLRQKHVYAKIIQSEEINQKLSPRRLPIYAYSKFEYGVELDPKTERVIPSFYSKVDICNTIKYPMEMGISGVIIWSTSNYMRKRCDDMAKYVETVLGPFSSAIIHRAQKCSEKECGGNGWKCAAVDRLPPFKCELALQPPTRCIREDSIINQSFELFKVSKPEPTIMEILRKTDTPEEKNSTEIREINSTEQISNLTTEWEIEANNSSLIADLFISTESPLEEENELSYSTIPN